jgi:hypothetical protein
MGATWNIAGLVAQFLQYSLDKFKSLSRKRLLLLQGKPDAHFAGAAVGPGVVGNQA